MYNFGAMSIPWERAVVLILSASSGLDAARWFLLHPEDSAYNLMDRIELARRTRTTTAAKTIRAAVAGLP